MVPAEPVARCNAAEVVVGRGITDWIASTIAGPVIV
jgi:hypothetical protein